MFWLCRDVQDVQGLCVPDFLELGVLECESHFHDLLTKVSKSSTATFVFLCETFGLFHGTEHAKNKGMTLDEAVAHALVIGPLNKAVERTQNAVRVFLSSKFTKYMLDHPEAEKVLRELHLEILNDFDSKHRRKT